MLARWLVCAGAVLLAATEEMVGVQVLPYWRAATGFVSDSHPQATAGGARFAVALSLLGTETEKTVRALGLTVSHRQCASESSPAFV